MLRIYGFSNDLMMFFLQNSFVCILFNNTQWIRAAQTLWTTVFLKLGIFYHLPVLNQDTH